MSAHASEGILDASRTTERGALVELLRQAYWMEIETVMSYVANSINPDGVRAQAVKQALAADIPDELAHAQQFAQRIKELYGVVPGSEEFAAQQRFLQPPETNTNIVHVIRGVIEAEAAAIAHYERILEAASGVDPVTEDMVVGILREEQAHKRMFEGFLKEYAAQGIGLA